METNVEQLIKDRSYGSLSHEELQAVEEWCASEQEFQQMKLLLQETAFLSSAMAIDPSPEIKKSLDAVFSAKHPGAHAGWSAQQQAVTPAPAPVIPLYRKTWFRVAAVAVLFLGTIPFWQLSDAEMKPQNRPEMAQLETAKPEEKTASSPAETTSETPSSETLQTVHAVPDGAMSVESDMAIAPAPVEIMNDEVMPVAADSYTRYYTVAKPSFDGDAISDDFTMDKSAETATFSSMGRNADLDPYSTMAKRNESRAISLAQQPNDMLDLLVPAF